ncbi:TPR-like protein [Basidiobolus meristosporus CBS 931.73]|uniref:peptidylprolyl isomerase n=1 Tax=Basidiobolus meristosporus CBS 931.73 TaxID=1314790 RepID=A0A1Y1YJG4_9FUNG|nr:TPR-like protein [Basidiobolus meristosporus CBS 931.73]|eukprot:ORX97896.1 TPR-like protein [Basidiobolus meristosporus CBS 931.73]
MEQITSDGGVVKLVLIAGSPLADPSWPEGTKATIHFAVHALDRKQAINWEELKKDTTEDGKSQDNHVLTRKFVRDTKLSLGSRTFELRTGMQFAVKGMELAVTSMKLGERSKFWMTPQYCTGYSQLESLIRTEEDREYYKDQSKAGKEEYQIHAGCSHGFTHRIQDLNDLVNCPLEFEIELLNVQYPGEFVKEVWEMNAVEKTKEAPKLKEQGTLYYKQKDFEQAADFYFRAISMLDSMPIYTVNPDEVDFDQVSKLLLTCRLNLAACELKMNKFDSVVYHCSQVIKADKKNVKGHFRRGVAYLQQGELDLAEKDFDFLQEHNLISQDVKPEFDKVVKELKAKRRQADSILRKSYQKLFR